MSNNAGQQNRGKNLPSDVITTDHKKMLTYARLFYDGLSRRADTASSGAVDRRLCVITKMDGQGEEVTKRSC